MVRAKAALGSYWPQLHGWGCYFQRAGTREGTGFGRDEFNFCFDVKMSMLKYCVRRGNVHQIPLQGGTPFPAERRQPTVSNFRVCLSSESGLLRGHVLPGVSPHQVKE